MDLKLSGLKAVVTGASKGLGFSVANELLNEGANVIINSRSETNLSDAAQNLSDNGHKPDTFHTINGDVTDPVVCKSLAHQANKLLDGIDILVTNSGGPAAGSFESLDTSHWEEAIDLSFRSHLHLIKSFLSYLKLSSAPSVLAVTSITVKYPLDNLILSNVIRTATAALIKSLSIELGSQGIRFNSLLPGWTLTDRVNNLLSYRADQNHSSIDDEKKRITKSIPLGRMAQPEEFARAAAFMVSPAASYITGVLLNIDGGITRSLL